MKHLKTYESFNNDNFKNWFGDSKVVDKKGQPLVVYHGSPDLRNVKNDGVFQTPTQKFRDSIADEEGVFFFSSDYSCARSYTDPRRAFDYQGCEEGIISVYLKIDNPYIHDNKNQSWKGTRKLVDEIKAMNKYDGIIIKNTKDNYNNTPRTKPTTVYVVFYPNQIKSANRNKGTFNINSNSIYENNIICDNIKDIPKYVIDYVSKFKSDEELLRSGGIPINMLDKWAFGFNENEITKLKPSKLKIRWKEDLENVLYEINKSNLSKLKWAETIDLSESIDIDYWEDKSEGYKRGFYIQDGHHRYYAAKILNKPLNVNLKIKINPIKELTNLSYDDFHRCVYKKLSNSIYEDNIKNIHTGKFVAVYYDKIGSREGVDIDLYNDILKVESYLLENINIEELINKDVNLKDYIEHGNYENDYTDDMNLNNPIILNKYGIVIDGYHRIAEKKSRGEISIKAFVPITKNNESKESNYLMVYHGGYIEGDIRPPFYVTDNEYMAKSYDDTVYKFELDLNANILDLTDLETFKKIKSEIYNNHSKLYKKHYNKGYWASDERVEFDYNILKKYKNYQEIEDSFTEKKNSDYWYKIPGMEERGFTGDYDDASKIFDYIKNNDLSKEEIGFIDDFLLINHVVINMNRLNDESLNEFGSFFIDYCKENGYDAYKAWSSDSSGRARMLEYLIVNVDIIKPEGLVKFNESNNLIQERLMSFENFESKSASGLCHFTDIMCNYTTEQKIDNNHIYEYEEYNGELSKEEIIEYTKKELKKIKKKGFVIGYRVIWIKDVNDIDENDLGTHFVSDVSNFHEEMIDYLFNNARKNNKNLDEYDDAYLITAKIPYNSINIEGTIWTNVEHPFESEIMTNDDSSVEIIKIEKIL